MCHIVSKESSISPLHSLGQDSSIEMSISFLHPWHHWHWCWCHGMPTVFQMAPLHSLGQDNQNEVKHGIFGHVTPLVLASSLCDANSINNGIIAYLGSRWSNWDATQCFGVMSPSYIIYMLSDITAHTSHVKTPKCNFYFCCYKHTCTNNKYDLQMSQKCHIPQLLQVHIWDSNISTNTSYEIVTHRKI